MYVRACVCEGVIYVYEACTSIARLMNDNVARVIRSRGARE